MNSNSEISQTQRVSRKKARTRAELLQAARTVFAARGYHEASIAEITAAADVGVGTFYLHFRDKDEIFVTLIKEGLRDIREQVTRVAIQQPLERMIPTVVRLIFQHAHKQRDLFRIALTGERHFRHYHAQVALQEGFTQLFETAQVQGQLEGYNTGLLAHFLTGIITQGVAWWFEHDEPGPEEMAEQVLLFLRNGLPAELLVEEENSL